MTIDLTRRDILAGLLVSIAAPAIIRTPGILMPVRDRRRIRLCGHVLFYPSGEGIREFYGDPVYHGPETASKSPTKPSLMS